MEGGGRDHPVCVVVRDLQQIGVVGEVSGQLPRKVKEGAEADTWGHGRQVQGEGDRVGQRFVGLEVRNP
jgi:hypothetical protein